MVISRGGEIPIENSWWYVYDKTKINGRISTAQWKEDRRDERYIVRIGGGRGTERVEKVYWVSTHIMQGGGKGRRKWEGEGGGGAPATLWDKNDNNECHARQWITRWHGISRPITRHPSRKSRIIIWQLQNDLLRQMDERGCTDTSKNNVPDRVS